MNSRLTFILRYKTICETNRLGKVWLSVNWSVRDPPTAWCELIRDWLFIGPGTVRDSEIFVIPVKRGFDISKSRTALYQNQWKNLLPIQYFWNSKNHKLANKIIFILDGEPWSMLTIRSYVFVIQLKEVDFIYFELDTILNIFQWQNMSSRMWILSLKGQS